MTPACVGHDPAIFDSTEWPDHVMARAICATCPVVPWCVDRAVSIARTSYRGGPAPDGTWGGVLWRAGHIVTRIPAICGTERGYQRHRTLGANACEACKAAHAENERTKASERRRKVA